VDTASVCRSSERPPIDAEGELDAAAKLLTQMMQHAPCRHIDQEDGRLSPATGVPSRLEQVSPIDVDDLDGRTAARQGPAVGRKRQGADVMQVLLDLAEHAAGGGVADRDDGSVSS